MSRPSSDPLVRFWGYVSKAPSCWVWIGPLYPNGYGMFPCKDEASGCWHAVLAHRKMWEVAYGAVGALNVLHSCDNPRCVNPAHLFLGTQHDNILDCIAKGRNSRGETHPIAKLTAAQVDEVRRRYRRKSRVDNQYTLAAEFGVSQQQISKIIRGSRWRQIA